MKRNIIIVLLSLFVMSVSSYAAQNRWVGKWISEEQELGTINSSMDGSATCIMTFYICADKFAYTVIDMKMNVYNDLATCRLSAKMTMPGIWEEEGNNLIIHPNGNLFRSEITDVYSRVTTNYYDGYYLSAGDKAMVEAMLNSELEKVFRREITYKDILGNADAISFLQLRENGVRLKKTPLSDDFSMIIPPKEDGISCRFDVIDKDNVPAAGFVRGALYHADGSVEVGLFLREEVLQSAFTRTYSQEGEIINNCRNYTGGCNEDAELAFFSQFADTRLSQFSEGVHTFHYSDGHVYEGEWLDSKPSGKGKMTWPDGMWQEGIFADGQFVSGKAVLAFEDGSKYIGECADGVPEGEGVLTYRDGAKLEGVFENGEFVSGKGSVTLENGYRYEGELAGMLPNGEGEARNGIYWMKGQWEEGVLVSGNGKIRYADNEYYEGAFKNGVPCGGGRRVTADGSYYDGRWDNGEFKYGKHKTPNGEYEGSFEGGIFREGKIKYKNQYEYNGTFDGTAFVEGTYSNYGLKLSGQWERMRLMNGTISVTGLGGYSSFEGDVDNGVVTNGTFHHRDNYTVRGLWNDYKDELPLVVTFPAEKGGDTVEATWNITDGTLVQDTELKYTWGEDGLYVIYTVGKKGKLSKPHYYDASGAAVKPKAAKDRTMNTTSEKGYIIPPIKIDDMEFWMSKRIILP